MVGLKPSFGRVPQWPLGAFAPVAVAGPITRTVRDAALMLSAIARFDLRDPFCLPPESHGDRDWRAGIEDGVAEMRVAVLRRPGFEAPVDWEGIAAVEQAAQLLIEAGAEVEEADPGLPDTREIFCRFWGVALARLVSSFPETRRHMLDPGLLEVAAASAGMPATAMIEMEALRIEAAHAMARLHQRYDLVLCPTVPGLAPLADAPVGDPAGGAVDGLGALDLRRSTSPASRPSRCRWASPPTACRARCRSPRRCTATTWCCARRARWRWRSLSPCPIWTERTLGQQQQARKARALPWTRQGPVGPWTPLLFFLLVPARALADYGMVSPDAIDFGKLVFQHDGDTVYDRRSSLGGAQGYTVSVGTGVTQWWDCVVELGYDHAPGRRPAVAADPGGASTAHSN